MPFQIKALDESSLAKLAEPQKERGEPRTKVAQEAPQEYQRIKIETFPCDFCGHCERPNKCVWSVVCPTCKAEPKQQCTRPGGLVALHVERWSKVGIRW